jgi:hypothetical protein
MKERNKESIQARASYYNTEEVGEDNSNMTAGAFRFSGRLGGARVQPQRRCKATAAADPTTQKARDGASKDSDPSDIGYRAPQ